MFKQKTNLLLYLAVIFGQVSGQEPVSRFGVGHIEQCYITALSAGNGQRYVVGKSDRRVVRELGVDGVDDWWRS